MLSPKQFAMIVLMALGWGPTFLLVKISLLHMPPLTMTLVRCIISCIFLLVFLLIKRVALSALFKNWRLFIPLALVSNALPFTLCAFGEQRASSGTAGIMEGMVPILTVIVSALWIRERKIKMFEVSGVLLGFLGVITIFYSGATDNVPGNEWGQLLLFLMALCFAIGFVYSEKTLRNISSMLIAFVQQFFGALFLLPLTIIEKPWQLSMPPVSFWWVMILMAGGSAIGWVIYYSLLESTTAFHASMATYFCPVIALFLGAVFLGEQLSLSIYVGTFFVVLSMLVTGGVLKIPSNWRRIFAKEV